ncbi:hypothetical protein B4135_3504 [Caldibacillus debilis]|uniref:Uncharacterized protein n=1 Tax=Caldibacillus debilis TaxID=301148 RepID=A0A150LE95_9BACI|nr:hypothetical protein B4135_3504 [Caldibacillus debilis]
MKSADAFSAPSPFPHSREGKNAKEILFAEPFPFPFRLIANGWENEEKRVGK